MRINNHIWNYTVLSIWHIFSIHNNTNGSFLYDASTSATFHALQLGETSLDTFTYSISDSDGQALASSTVTMTINGNDIDRVPLAVDDQFSVAEDSGVSQLTLLLNDAIGDPPYTIISLATGFKDPEGDEGDAGHADPAFAQQG